MSATTTSAAVSGWPWRTWRGDIRNLSLCFYPVLALLAAACAGIMQRPLPQAAQSFRAVARGTDLRVGAAVRDITPAGSVYLGGFDLNRKSTGIAHALEVRAMVFVLGEMEVALVGIDTLGLIVDDADWIKSGCAGFQNGNVFLCASHTHAGPDMLGLWGWWFLTSGRDREYVALVRRQVAAAVAEARQNVRAASLFVGTVTLPDEGLIKNANREGVFDRRFLVVQAKDRDTLEPLATLFHLACHPEVLSRRNTLISSDFPGALCARWRAAGYGPAVFANGALGSMVSPHVPERTAAGVDAMGERLFELAEEALDGMRPLPVDRLEVRRQELFMPLDSEGLEMARATQVLERELYDGCLRTTVGHLWLGGLHFAAVPGEMEPLLADDLRAAFGEEDLVVLGLVDDEVGYLMRTEDARDRLFAYERTMSPGDEAGEQVVRALLESAR